MTRLLTSGLILFTFLLTACELFTPRTPEAPTQEGGTYIQPDTPEQVIDNIQSAIAELNTQNYRRSLAEDLVFTPTATAQAGSQDLWASWSRAEEEQYFSTLTAAAQNTSGNELRLNDRTLSILSEDRYALDATYVLTVHHRRPALPETVQGRLAWVLQQGEDGLWHLQEWTDQELGSSPSWSDLKAEFVK